MAAWFWYAVVAAVLYGAHQIFTRLASERIGDGLGGFVVEASAAMFILRRSISVARSRCVRELMLFLKSKNDAAYLALYYNGAGRNGRMLRASRRRFA